MTEEILHDTKEPVKNAAFDDDEHFLKTCLHLFHPRSVVILKCSSTHNDMVPSSHADDIETPPPNAIAG